MNLVLHIPITPERRRAFELDLLRARNQHALADVAARLWVALHVQPKRERGAR